MSLEKNKKIFEKYLKEIEFMLINENNYFENFLKHMKYIRLHRWQKDTEYYQKECLFYAFLFDMRYDFQHDKILWEKFNELICRVADNKEFY